MPPDFDEIHNINDKFQTQLLNEIENKQTNRKLLHLIPFQQYNVSLPFSNNSYETNVK